MVKTKWATISLPVDLLDELDKFVLTDDAKKHGLTSKSQIASLLVRKFLDNDIDIFSKSGNKESIRKELEKEFEKKFEEFEKSIPKMMMQIMPLFKENSTSKERLKALSFFEGADPPLSEIVSEELEKIKQEKMKKRRK